MLRSTVIAFLLCVVSVASEDYRPPILIRNVTSTKFSKSWDLSTCVLPKNSVTGKWKVGAVFPTSAEGCTFNGDKFPWIRLNSYRSGGWRCTHWKYVDTEKDTSRCLKDWLYYAKDGKTLITKVDGYYTLVGDTGKDHWCATWVYQSGGLRGYQWDYCINCTMVVTHPAPGSPEEEETPQPTLKTKNTQSSL